MRWPDQARKKAARPPSTYAQAHPLAGFLRVCKKPSTPAGALSRSPNYLPLCHPSSPALFRPHSGTPRPRSIFPGRPGRPGLRGWVSKRTPGPPTGEKPRHADPGPPRPGGSKRPGRSRHLGVRSTSPRRRCGPGLRPRSGLGGGSRPGSPEPRRDARRTW